MNRSRALRWTARTAMALGGGIALWWLVAVVLSSDRAVGFRDEGLYLLAADPPSKTAAWVTPFGWGTAPLFRLLSYDIAHLRTLAVWLLVVAGGVLGWATGRWLTGEQPDDRHRHATVAGVAAVGALGAPILVSALLRTPGYNWVNLVGLTVAAGGAVVACTLADDGIPLVRRPRAHLAAAGIAFGTCFAVPAKPSSGPLMLLATAAVVAPHLRRRTLHLAALVIGWGLAFAALAVILGVWPSNFLSTLWRSTGFPPLHPNQTVAGALRDLLRTPKVAARELRHLRPAAIALIAVAVGLAVVVRRRVGTSGALRCLPLALVLLAATGTAVPWPVIGGTSPVSRFAWTGTANAAVLLLLGALVHLYANWRATDRAARRRAVAYALYLVALAVTFAFGSAMGLYHQMGLASLLLWLAAAGVVAATGRDAVPAWSVLLVVLATAAMLTGNVVDSRHHPFDALDVALQTTPVTIGAHHAPLLVDAATASFLDRLQPQVAEAGFCTGTPLIGMAWNWSSTVPFAVGAEVPDELMLTLFGYPDAPAVLDFTMPYISGPEWRDAWVLTTDPATIEPAQAAELRAALDRLPTAVGREFPGDYTLAVDVDGTQFWRPTDAVVVDCATG